MLDGMVVVVVHYVDASVAKSSFIKEPITYLQIIVIGQGRLLLLVVEVASWLTSVAEVRAVLY